MMTSDGSLTALATVHCDACDSCDSSNELETSMAVCASAVDGSGFRVEREVISCDEVCDSIIFATDVCDQ